MKRLITLFAASLHVCAVFGAPTTPLTVAVLDFDSGKEEGIKDYGAKIATLVNALLSAEGSLVTVERAELEKVLGEQELGLSGNVTADSAAKIGQLTGARVLITGKVMKIDKEVMVVSKVIGTETGRVYGQTAKGTPTAISDISADIAKKVTEVLASKGNMLVAKPQERADYVAAIKKALPAGAKPTVSVKLPEQHYGAPVNDPAAETELVLLLKECGFEVLDAAKGGNAAIEITGEAFSAFGLRRGNLTSCKARVEVKALNTKTGQIISVDRETSVALDISEQTAAKTALQKAASQIGVRLLPKLGGG
jgi:hypothetical protein